MIQTRPSSERGHVDFGWLQSAHSFSFGNYYDPAHMGFRQLRVINEDRVEPGRGFDTHGHRDMEIISYVLEGSLEHRDSMGNGSVIRPGEVQRMSAGTGVLHSEYNPSDSQATRFLQIWLLPEKRGIEPGYEQRYFSPEERRGKLRLVVSPDGRDDSLRVHQDAFLYAGLLGTGQRVEHELAPGRSSWVQVAAGQVSVGGKLLRQGDGAAITDQRNLVLEGMSEDGEAEILLFDLA